MQKGAWKHIKLARKTNLTNKSKETSAGDQYGWQLLIGQIKTEMTAYWYNIKIHPYT
jgi:hypothetical protein